MKLSKNIFKVATLAIVLLGVTNCAERHLYSVEDAPGAGTATVVNTLDVTGVEKFMFQIAKIVGQAQGNVPYRDQYWECQDTGKALVCHRACGKEGPGEIACQMANH